MISLSDRISVGLGEFLEMSRLRKTTVYKLIKTGELRSALICGRRMIVVSSYLDFLARQREAEASPVAGPTGLVYFIAAGNGHVKIGYSTKPKARLRELQTGSRAALRLIATTPGTYADERDLHTRFSMYRSHGEWFRFKGELRAYVEGLYVEGLSNG